MGKKLSYFVFCDVDETLIHIKSMFSFLKFIAYSGKFHHLAKRATKFLLLLTLLQKAQIPRTFLNRFYYRFFKGVSLETTRQIVDCWFQDYKITNTFNSRVLTLLKKHQDQGAHIVLISGSFQLCLAPIAKIVNAYTILCTTQSDYHGVFTGKIGKPQTIGKGKAIAIQAFMQLAPGIELQNCYAYGDDISDIPMLKLVGHPTAVSGTIDTYAKKQSWPIV